ncbi:restriction endonuclease subunit S [Citrobacter freundii]|uniref:restriction endonuclease subunit S n=1 Tax=Enterobacteriaceae TaxID=543 RepID=UPI001985F5F2|nr:MULTISPECIES: restriction endonuclease subunit S [Enterobacteriaceae]ELB4075228.1 restriction endonuclease subunit S [Klebsiella pneumoniae]MDK6337036.1 restriction endonuclease subunit S [Escherichia coli]HED1256898.1 restriction endonuclease subunit S [Citrobacter amalonaticus]EKX2186036.1 restriction endonuclease subunit S [Citrobacter freundii]MBD7771980.1 restriction endonuclease subunit S [Klebsiella pneumoniae]
MSGLNFLNKLLDGVDVEWLSLGELGDFIRGNGLQKKDFVESGFPAIHYGQIYTRYGLSADKTFTYVLPELANKLRKAQKNDLLLATTSENDEDVVKPLAWLGDNVAISGDMMLFRHEQNVKYLAYFFQSEIFQTQKMKYITGAKVRRVSSGDLSKIKIPIPSSNNPEKSLAIQAEIVRILDKFTALTAELTAELTMRKKQYNYYRDQLLSFDDEHEKPIYLEKLLDGVEVEWKTLGEVAVIGTGNHDTQDAIEHGKYIFYARGREPLKLNVFDFDETAIITAGDGAGVGKVFHYAKGKYALHQRAYRIVPNAFMNPRFVYHYITAYFFTYIQKASVSSSVTSLRRPMFLNFPIPVPPSEEQARIVEILDKFDTLTNSITEGLPREIELRQKQYEYYRDLLFSFPKPDSVTN